MDRSLSILIVLVGLFSTIVWAQAPSATLPTPTSTGASPSTPQSPSQSSLTDVTYICQRQKDIRWIRSYVVDGNRCRSLYSKEGFVQTVSSAQNFNSCKVVIDNIKANIEEGGFKCKEAQLISMVEIE